MNAVFNNHMPGTFANTVSILNHFNSYSTLRDRKHNPHLLVSEAAMTHHHTLGGIKQQKHVFLWFQRPESKIKVSVVLCSWQRLQVGIASFFLPNLLAADIPWLVAMSLRFLLLWSHCFLL